MVLLNDNKYWAYFTLFTYVTLVMGGLRQYPLYS